MTQKSGLFQDEIPAAKADVEAGIELDEFQKKFKLMPEVAKYWLDHFQPDAPAPPPPPSSEPDKDAGTAKPKLTPKAKKEDE